MNKKSSYKNILNSNSKNVLDKLSNIKDIKNLKLKFENDKKAVKNEHKKLKKQVFFEETADNIINIDPKKDAEEILKNPKRKLKEFFNIKETIKRLKAEKNELSEEKKLELEEKKIKAEIRRKKILRVKKKLKKYFDKFESFRSKFGWTQFQVEGRNLSRIITHLSKDNYLKKVAYKDRVLTFSVRSISKDKIIDLLNRLCYDYKINKVYGFIPSMLGIYKRIGILFGLIASIIILVIYPHFVTKIYIDGTLNAQSKSILKQSGLVPGNFLWDLNEKEISDKLLALDGVAFASVNRNGSHIHITLKPEHALSDYVDIKGGLVLSTKQATITRVIVHGGTSLVKYGDVVKKGDALIGNYVLVGEEEVETPAKGKVFGKVIYKKTFFYPKVKEVEIKGKTKSYTKGSMFGIVPRAPKYPFKEYILEKEIVSNDFFIPYKYYKWHFTEIKKVKQKCSMTEAQMVKDAYSRLVTNVSAGGNVLDSFYEIKHTKTGTKITSVIEAEERIDR